MPNELLKEVKKAIDLFMDKTYNETDFYNHVLQIITDNNKSGELHKLQLERLLFKLDELQKVELKVFSGHKNETSNRNAQRSELYKKKDALLQMGYSIDKFKNKTVQQRLI